MQNPGTNKMETVTVNKLLLSLSLPIMFSMMIQALYNMPVYGLTSGMLPVMAYNLGAKQKKRIMGTLRYGMLYMAVIMLAGTVIFQLIPNQLLSLFNASGAMREIGVPALRIISTYFIFEGFCLISQTSFQSLGRGLASLLSSLVRQIIVLFPVAYVLSLSGNINYVWIAYPITGVVSSVVCLLLFKNVYRKNIVPIPDLASDNILPNINTEATE